MRIVHVITRLIVGGAQENTIASVLGLRQKSGLDVSLISGPASGPEGSLEGRFAGQPQLLTLVPELVRPLHPWKDILAWRKLTALFRSQPPQIVHTHSGKAGLLGRLAAARARVPVIVHTIHGPSFGPFQAWPANSLFWVAERVAAKVTTQFVVVAEAMKEQYLAAGIGRREQYTKIYSGFALEPFRQARNDPALRARFGLAAEDIVVGKIARLFKLKGHEDLFAVAPEVIRECPRVKFLLVGDGAWRGRFEAQAKSLGLGRHFIFAGLVPPEEVPRLVGVMDLLVHLSLREGLPRALPQALAAGKPVVAYDCDGASEACVHEETGLLVSAGDRKTLSGDLVRLARDPALRRKLGEQGRRWALARFSVEQMVEELHQLYLRLAEPQARSARSQ